MANETFSSNYERIIELSQQIGAAGAEVENILNNYIHNAAPEVIKPSIEGLVPVSDRDKRHAKFSNPFGRQENYNLAVKIITSKEFNYLVFPDEGKGRSVNNSPLDFTGRGLDAMLPQLADEMTEQVKSMLGF